MKARYWINKAAGFIYTSVWFSLCIVCSYYAGQLDQLDGTLTLQVLTDHLYNTIISFYGGTIFQAIVWVFAIASFGCWIRAFRTNDRIDACEVAISVIASILVIINLFLPGSEKEFWSGNLPYTILITDICLLFGILYHWVWNIVVFFLSTVTDDSDDNDSESAEEA